MLKKKIGCYETFEKALKARENAEVKIYGFKQ
jgi:hypothetical protein